jgi:hypothetical protein
VRIRFETDYPLFFPFRAEKTSTMMPITAAVVNPIVATIDISIKYLPDIFIARERNGARRPHHSDCKPSDSKGGYGFSDSVYARSCDHPLMAGVCAAK